jgi:hypothetical protein
MTENSRFKNNRMPHSNRGAVPCEVKVPGETALTTVFYQKFCLGVIYFSSIFLYPDYLGFFFWVKTPTSNRSVGGLFQSGGADSPPDSPDLSALLKRGHCCAQLGESVVLLRPLSIWKELADQKK